MPAIAQRHRGRHSASVTRFTDPFRPAGLSLCLLIVAATGGCAHFHNAEVRAQERTQQQARQPVEVQHSAPPVAEVERPPAPAPQVAVQAMPPPALADRPAEPIAQPAPAAPAEAVNPPRQALRQAPVAAPPAPDSVPASDDAIIIFANIPGAHCVTCETLKLSVAPSGQVLMERGSWAAGRRDWHYRRSRTQVTPARAVAFAASLSADRPAGDSRKGAGCATPATGDEGLSIEWIDAGRHDRLIAKFGCAGDGSSQIAERLRHAPDLLGLRSLILP